MNHKSLLLTGVNCFLTIAIVLVYLEHRDADLLLAWAAGFFGSWIASLILPALLGVSSRSARLTPMYYLYFSVLGLFLAYGYHHSIGTFFGPAFDDGFYYAAVRANTTDMSNADSLFDVIFVLPYLVAQTIRSAEPRLLDLLPFNWLGASLLAPLADALTKEVTGKECPRPLLWLSLVGSSVLMDGVVHFFRDGWMLVFFLSSCLLAVRQKWWAAVLMAVVCGMFRGADGLLALFYVALAVVARKGSTRLLASTVRLGALILAVAGILTVAVLPVGAILRSMTTFTSQSGESRTGASILESRWTKKQLQAEEDDAKSDTTNILRRLGPVGCLGLPLTTLFAPCRFCTPLRRDSTIIQSHDGYSSGWGFVFSATHLWGWVTTVGWIVLGPLIIFGLYEAIRSKETAPIGIAVLYLVVLLGVTYVSGQARHRCAFLVLNPVLVTVGFYARDIASMNRKFFLRALFVVGIIGVNFLPLLR